MGINFICTNIQFNILFEQLLVNKEQINSFKQKIPENVGQIGHLNEIKNTTV